MKLIVRFKDLKLKELIYVIPVNYISREYFLEDLEEEVKLSIIRKGLQVLHG